MGERAPMRQRRQKVGLMVLVALVPFVVIFGIVMTALATSNEETNGGMSREGSSVADNTETGRRLQSSTYNFATQLEMTVCLNEMHSSDSATVSAEQFKSAVMEVIPNAPDEQYVKVDTSLDRCTYDDWERRVSVYNLETDNLTAAEVASRQVDYIYVDPGTDSFFSSLSEKIRENDPNSDGTQSEDFDLESLGFLVIWLDADGDVLSTQATSSSKDVVTIAGTDVWWPWWAWLIYAGVVLCCICPILFFFFKWRRDKEAEEDGYTGPAGKELGTPAPPSATSTNPQGGNYPVAEDSKTGQ